MKAITALRHRLTGAIAALLASAACATLQAQTPEQQAAAILQTDSATRSRLVTRATLFGIGFANVFDTYLSPQEYTGIEARVARESMRMTAWMDGRVSRQTFFQGNVGYTRNRADNNNTLSALVNWSYGLHYHFPLTPGFRLLAGAAGDINGGFVYNLRNGNNPAQARAYIDLDASAIAIWDLRIGRLPLTLRYQASFPLAGVMFAPHYGQSYYEIFSLGNAGGVARFTSLHNHPSLRQLLTADFPAGHVKVRLAYMWDAQQARLNGIKMHAYSHVFLVGLVKELYLFRNKK